MNNQQQIESVIINGPAGNLEAIVHQAHGVRAQHIGIICHPHPQHQGSMHNKVVTTLVKAFSALGLTCVRFNFRGVGASDGEFANAVGETDDCIAVIDWACARWSNPNIWLAGFSFGSYVAAAASLQRKVFQLINIAPPVHYYDFASLALNCPCLVVQGDNDEIIEANLVHQWFGALTTNKTLIAMTNTSHYFHGKLIELKTNIEQHYSLLRT